MESFNTTRAAADLRPRHSESGDMHKVLRGEISAVDTYRQVIEKLAGDVEATRLEQFSRDHQDAVSYWRTQLNMEGEVAETDAGAWGTAVTAFTGMAKLLGNTAALKALKEGEEHGLSLYKDMLESDDISAAHKQQIRDTFIPNQERHITSLDAMMKMQ